MNRGRVLLRFVLALIGVAVGHTLLWRWAEQQLWGGWDAWTAERRAQGWVVQAGEPASGGWPFSARLVIKQVAVEGADIPGGFAWRAERITLVVEPLHPGVLKIFPDGKQGLRLGRLPDLPYVADRLEIDTPLDPSLPGEVADLTAGSIRAGSSGGREAFVIGLLRVHAELRPDAGRGQPALVTAASAEAVALPTRFTWAFGGRISSASMEGAVSGPVPPGLPLAERAAAWRNAGGSVDLRHLALGWGPLGVTGSATLGLDGSLQPEGMGTARIVGYLEALDALAGSGAITPGTKLAVKAIAGLIASTPAGGGPPEVELPLTLQDRTVAVRQIPLARLPPLTWPPG